MTPADLRVPPEAEPLALADLTDREREFVRTIRSIPRHRWPVLARMMDRMTDGMATEEAELRAGPKTAGGQVEQSLSTLSRASSTMRCMTTSPVCPIGITC